MRKSARYLWLWAVLQSHQVMLDFTAKGFQDHPAIFPVINFHLFQITASKVSVEKFIADARADLKNMGVRCNQIDALQAKLQKLANATPSKDKCEGGGNNPKPN